MPSCSNCGRELPPGAFFCPDCGAVVPTTPPAAEQPPSFEYGGYKPEQPATASADEGFGFPQPGFPEEKKRYLTGRKVLALAVIIGLMIFLVGVVINNNLPNQSPQNGSPVNSPSTPVTGAQLYGAYIANESQADASYTNRTIYVQGDLDFGVIQDSGTGQFFSSVNSGNVVLIWSNQSQTGQLIPGAQVLAECFVDGLQLSQGAGYLVYLQDCHLISVQAPPSTTTSVSVPVNSV